jgi:hypothetical protein
MRGGMRPWWRRPGLFASPRRRLSPPGRPPELLGGKAVPPRERAPARIAMQRSKVRVADQAVGDDRPPMWHALAAPGLGECLRCAALEQQQVRDVASHLLDAPRGELPEALQARGARPARCRPRRRPTPRGAVARSLARRGRRRARARAPAPSPPPPAPSASAAARRPAVDWGRWPCCIRSPSTPVLHHSKAAAIRGSGQILGFSGPWKGRAHAPFPSGTDDASRPPSSGRGSGASRPWSAAAAREVLQDASVPRRLLAGCEASAPAPPMRGVGAAARL